MRARSFPTFFTRSAAACMVLAGAAALSLGCGGPRPAGDVADAPSGEAVAGDAIASDGADDGADITAPDVIVTEAGPDVVIPADCISVPETCNGMDDDCNGMIDDGLGTSSCGVGACRRMVDNCTAGMPTMCTPMTGSMETCNGIDDDCNGIIDDGLAPLTCGMGMCMRSIPSCMGGVPQMCTPGMGIMEACNNLDDNCNGMIDEGLTQSCYSGPTGTLGVGMCRAGMQTCVAGGFTACMGDVVPRAETCNNMDDNCNGMTDEGTTSCYTGPAGTAGVGICRAGSQTCTMGVGGPCTGQTLPGATEACGNRMDDNCNGTVDEGCGGTLSLMCPADVITPAGTAVMLAVTPTLPAGRTASGYVWTITAAPTGGIATATWNPNPPTARTETFRPTTIGSYTIHVVVTDNTGATAACDTHVRADPHGLRLQVFWDGAGDLDLHLHNNVITSPWFTMNDCHYNQRMPAWDLAGTADDPVLDLDNTTSNGPELLHIDRPVIGEMYTIAVHQFQRGAGRIATLEVYCGPLATPVATRVSRALTGTANGNCTANDFWRVARVAFTTATACTVTPIDTYTPSSAACMAF